MAKSHLFDEAERLYIAGHKLEKIGGEAPDKPGMLPEYVSVTTLSRWKQTGDWDGKHKAAMASLRNVAEILQEIVEEKIMALRAANGLDAQALDAICKATASIERLKRGAYDFRTIAVEVMGRFAEWLRHELSGKPEEIKSIAGRIQAWFKSIE